MSDDARATVAAVMARTIHGAALEVRLSGFTAEIRTAMEACGVADPELLAELEADLAGLRQTVQACLGAAR